MATAVGAIVERGGAFVAVDGGIVVAEFPTPLLGMASDLNYPQARASTAAIVEAWRELGCTFEIPFGYLEMVGATTEPAIRISTKGLVRVSTSGNLDNAAIPWSRSTRDGRPVATRPSRVAGRSSSGAEPDPGTRRATATRSATLLTRLLAVPGHA